MKGEVYGKRDLSNMLGSTGSKKTAPGSGRPAAGGRDNKRGKRK